MHRWLFAAALAAASLASTLAHAQPAWPDRPIRLIVPFPAGGQLDVVARLVAERISPVLGQPIVVEARPGADGNIATELVAKSAPDGYIWLAASPPTTIQPSVRPQTLRYDPIRDFEPVALIGTSPFVFVVPASLPVNTIGEFVAYAKARPDGSVTFASSGAGSSTHLAGELFQSLTQTKVTHIPYKGMGQAVLDLVGGQVTVMFGPPPALLPHIKSGKLKALAVADTQRSPLFGEIPTSAEAGVPGLESRVWYGIFAPAGTPAAVIARINADTIKALAAPDVVETLATQGATPAGGDPASFGAFLKKDIATTEDLMRKAGLPLTR